MVQMEVSKNGDENVAMYCNVLTPESIEKKMETKLLMDSELKMDV